jgi:hypothetical protein
MEIEPGVFHKIEENFSHQLQLAEFRLFNFFNGVTVEQNVAALMNNLRKF